MESQSPDSSSPTTRTLSYAPRPRILLRRIICISMVVLLLVAIAMVYRWRDAIEYRVAEYYWFRQCMNHVTPPGTVLKEEDVLRAVMLITTNPDDANGFLNTASSNPVAIYVPAALRRLDPLIGPNVLYRSNFPMLYLGPLHTPSDGRRLVIIQNPGFAYDYQASRLEGTVIRPPTWTTPAIPRLQPPRDARSLYPANFAPAVADPADRSHLTIAFDMPGYMSGTINVNLQDDDTLLFSVERATTRPAKR